RIRPDRHRVRAERGHRGRDVDPHDAIRIDHVRRRPEEQPVHHAEHRGVRPDAEPQREHRGECEPRAPGEGAQRVAQVGEEGVHAYRSAAAYRSVTAASTTPMAMPLANSTPHSANIMRMTARGSAPSAMRTPISTRRRVTRYDITPYSPIAATSRARTPKNPDSQAINRSVTSKP